MKKYLYGILMVALTIGMLGYLALQSYPAGQNIYGKLTVSNRLGVNSGEAQGSQSVAMGPETIAAADNSIAMGYGSIASGWVSTSLGYLTNAAGDNSTSMGESAAAVGKNSTAMGLATYSQPYASLFIGRYNIRSGTYDSWQPNDPVFVIGNGTSSADSNALTVLKKGWVGINTSEVTATLEVIGQVKIVDGTQGASKVLTSDNSGLATWQVVSSAGIASTAAYATLSGTSSNCSQLSNYVHITGETMTGKLTVEADFRVTGEVWYYDSRGYLNNLGNLTSHLAELSDDTLLDKSRSTISCEAGVLTYTLYALDGVGAWNFNGVISAVVTSSASVVLVGGTNSTPEENYVYFENVGGTTPTLKRSTTDPGDGMIMVAAFLVGSVEGSTYSIYGYDRYMEETDSFVNRTINRIASSGTLYESGFVPIFSTTTGTIDGGTFYNGIFKMFTTDVVSTGAFTSITGAVFNSRTAPTQIVSYSGGETIATNKYFNVVWGITPTSTTSSGATATTPRLYSIVQSKPASEYTTASLAREDDEGMTNYYPADTELKRVFVPIARTVLKKGGEFQAFPGGKYYQDIRGKITSGGGAATPVDLSGYVPYTGATDVLDMGVKGITTTGYITGDSISLSSIEGVYIGANTVIGTWREIRSGNDIVKQRYETLTVQTDFLAGSVNESSYYNPSYYGSYAIDNNPATRWSSTVGTGVNAWVMVDLGAGVTKTPVKFTLTPFYDALGIATFKFYGSNDGTNFTELYSGTHANTASLETYTFANTTAYRWFKIITLSFYGGGTTASIVEMEAIEADGSPWFVKSTLTSNGTMSVSALSSTGQYTNTLANGTTPMVITSATKVSNLNVDSVDGVNIAALTSTRLLRYNSSGTQIENATVTETSGALGGITTLTTSGNTSIGTAESRQKLSVFGTIETYGTGGVKFSNGTTQTSAMNSSGITLDATAALSLGSIISGTWRMVREGNNLVFQRFETVGGSYIATGGTISTSGAYTIHTFTSSATFSATGGTFTAEVLVVGGGGGGNGGLYGTHYGGGGGGGTVIYNSAYSVASAEYPIIVGAGGAGIGTGTASQGVSSTFGTIVATGGTGTVNTGVVGGANANYTGGTGTGPAGGGGAGGGGNGGSKNGGVGYQTEPGASINGTHTHYAGGGGSMDNTPSNYTPGVVEAGGGVAVAMGQGTDGTANTGGGGGAGQSSDNSVRGGNGGSGIVIIKYQTENNVWVTKDTITP